MLYCSVININLSIIIIVKLTQSFDLIYTHINYLLNRYINSFKWNIISFIVTEKMNRPILWKYVVKSNAFDT